MEEGVKSCIWKGEGVDSHDFTVHAQLFFFFFQEPKCVVLGKTLKPVAHGAKHRIKEMSDCFYYIPILETMTVLLNNKKIQEEVLKEPQYRDDGKLGDFTDGVVFSNHVVFYSDAQALQIILYYDDCDLCNSAGSHVTKHKIAFFYFTLGNFRHEVRSKLDAIFLLAVVKTSHLKKYGFDEVLKPFLNDLKILEDGYFFTVGNSNIPITGAVSVFCGDTPASNLAGGFKEGVSFAVNVVGIVKPIKMTFKK